MVKEQGINSKASIKQLKNGLLTIMHSNQHLHKITLSIYFKAGIMYEEITDYGISHLVKNMLYRNWNGTVQKDLYHLSESLGGTLKGSTHKGYVRFQMTVSPDHFKEALLLFRKLFDEHQWLSKEIGEEKQVVLKRLEFIDDDYENYVNRKYSGDPCLNVSVMGRRSNVRRFSCKRVNDWKKRMLAPENACFILTGKVSEGNYAMMLEEFGNIKKSGQEPMQLHEVNIVDFGRRTSESLFIDAMEDDLSYACIMFDVDLNKTDRHVFNYLYNILLLGDNAKLGYLLRDKFYLTDDVDSDYDIYGRRGRLVIEFSVGNADLEKALKIVFEVLKETKVSVAREDLESPRVFLTENQYWKLDEPEEFNEFIGWHVFREGEDERTYCDLNHLVEKYGGISAEDVQEAAKDIFRPENLMLVVSNNKNNVGVRKLKRLLKELRASLLDA